MNGGGGRSQREGRALTLALWETGGVRLHPSSIGAVKPNTHLKPVKLELSADAGAAARSNKPRSTPRRPLAGGGPPLRAASTVYVTSIDELVLARQEPDQ